MEEAGKAAAALRDCGVAAGVEEPRRHSPARVVVEVLQHRVAEEGTRRALKAHRALRVEVVGAGRDPRGHQRQQQRSEPPGAGPHRSRAAHPQAAAALRLAPQSGLPGHAVARGASRALRVGARDAVMRCTASRSEARGGRQRAASS